MGNLRCMLIFMLIAQRGDALFMETRLPIQIYN